MSLIFFVIIYIIYFSTLTILRYQTLNASYFDLGIMQQTVYNTYQALLHHDFSRFLELTDPHGYTQITRMAIHNDVILAFIAPFYMLNSSPSTLVVIQTIVLAVGAIAVYKIAHFVFPSSQFIAFIFGLSYLLYSPMERANIYDFHAVTFATTTLLFMFYFWLKKSYKLTLFCFFIALLTKEEISLMTILFSIFIMVQGHQQKQLNIFQSPRHFLKDLWKSFSYTMEHEKGNAIFASAIFIVSLTWFMLSLFYIIPFFRAGGHHFALGYYSDFQSDTLSFFGHALNADTARYFYFLLGPLGFSSLLSPLYLLIAVPEFAINLLSKNENMHNIIFHYTSALQPWIFVSSIYGIKTLNGFFHERLHMEHKKALILLGTILFITTLSFAYFKGPLPYAREHDTGPFYAVYPGYKDVSMWSKKLTDETVKVATTGHIAPYFASRRYLYTLVYYYKADYVVIQKDEVLNGGEKALLMPAYVILTNDKHYIRIYNNNDIEVYKKNIHTTL